MQKKVALIPFPLPLWGLCRSSPSPTASGHQTQNPISTYPKEVSPNTFSVVRFTAPRVAPVMHMSLGTTRTLGDSSEVLADLLGNLVWLEVGCVDSGELANGGRRSLARTCGQEYGQNGLCGAEGCANLKVEPGRI